MNTYWFRRKKFGYGFTPISPEGLVCTLLVIGLLLLNAYGNGMFAEYGPTIWEVIDYSVDLIIIVAVFYLFAEKKAKPKRKNSDLKQGSIDPTWE